VTTLERELTKKQLSKKIGKSERTINRYMVNGMPHDKNRNGHARFNYKEAKKWLKGD